MGGLSIGVSVIRRALLIEKKLETLDDNTLTIFPNPAKLNGQVRIQWKKFLMNDQQIQLVNMAGQVLLTKTICIKNFTLFTDLDLAPSSAGIYIVHVTDLKTHKTQNARLLVE